MANIRSTKVSRRKPVSVTNLEVKDESFRSGFNSLLGLKKTHEHILSNHKTRLTDAVEINTNDCLAASSCEVTRAPKHLNGNYQTWRLLNSVIEGQWKDAEESLSLGADITFLALLKDQTCLQEVARFLVCNLPTRDDEAKQTLLGIVIDSFSNSHKIMTENIKANYQATGKEDTSAKGNSMSSGFSNTIDSVVKQWFRWGLGAVNLGLEVCQAVTSQEAAVGKIKADRRFLLLTALLSSICLILTVWEIGHEMRKDGVKWRKRGRYYFFYYPGKEAAAYGSFTTWFGLIIAMVQFGVNCTSLVTKTAVIKFDYLALMFSVFYLIWTLSSSSGSSHGERAVVGMVKCGSDHDRVEGRFVQGRWVFECLQCRMDISV